MMRRVTAATLALLCARPDGAAASHAWYLYDASTHSTPFEAMSATQVWDRVEETNHTYVYGANEFFFENGVTGYFGGQHDGPNRTIVVREPSPAAERAPAPPARGPAPAPASSHGSQQALTPPRPCMSRVSRLPTAR